MRAWIGRVGRMTASDYQTAIEVMALALWVEAAISVVPFSRLLDRMKRASPGTADPLTVLEYSRLRRFVAVVYEILPFPATCLRQSLVLYRLLARRGVLSRFCVGVKTDGRALSAHAWIECDGLPRDTSAATYSELVANGDCGAHGSTRSHEAAETERSAAAPPQLLVARAASLRASPLRRCSVCDRVLRMLRHLDDRWST